VPRASSDYRRAVPALIVLVCGLVACSGSAPSGTSPSSLSVSTATPPVSPIAEPTPSASVAVEQSTLPQMTKPSSAGGTRIKVTHDVDWTLVAYGKAWVKGVGRGVGIFDAASGRALGSVAVPEGPCAAMDAGFGAVWTVTCGSGGVSRIDASTGRVTGHVRVDVPATGESSIGVGEGAVWALAEAASCGTCRLVKIDPTKVKVVERYAIPSGATAVRAGLGGVWVTYFSDDRVLHVDPSNGSVVAAIPVAAGPRFFDVGEGGVWVMAQTAGALCHIDTSSDRLISCIQIDPYGVEGGDLTVGGGSVWFRGTAELVAQVDPESGKVVARFGPGQGSGSASGGSGRLWVSAHDVASLYVIPVP
jgi:hypothetical protein